MIPDRRIKSPELSPFMLIGADAKGGNRTHKSAITPTLFLYPIGCYNGREGTRTLKTLST